MSPNNHSHGDAYCIAASSPFRSRACCWRYVFTALYQSYKKRRFTFVMNEKRIYRSASDHEISLYCHVGEAVCSVQFVEDALSHSIVLKAGTPPSKAEADQSLEKYRKYTLGKAIGIAREETIYSELILSRLQDFLNERNWLIHKSVAQGTVNWEGHEHTDSLIDRIRAITKQAQELLQMIEEDLIAFSEVNGKDMSKVKADIRKHYK